MIKVNSQIIVFPDYAAVAVQLADPVQQREVAQLPIKDREGDLFLLPWTPKVCTFLCNIGVDMTPAAPFMFENHKLVEGKYPPMRHQLLTAAFFTLHNRGYILNEPRLGKTGSAILALDYLQRIRSITGGVLIITTYTTMHGVWKASINAMLPNSSVQVVHGKKRVEALQTPAEFYVTNYDSCRLDTPAFMEAIREGRIGAILIDELTNVGNSQSQRHKAIYEMCNKSGVKCVWGMTGSPADNPEMVYGMCRAVNPGKLPCTSKTTWLNLTTYQWGYNTWERSLSRSAPETIRKTMQPAIRFKKADILDLPPVTTQTRGCKLSAEQTRSYRELRADALTLLQSGESITAANGGVLLSKLMQVALGIVRDADGTPCEIPHKERTQTILEAIAETQRKVVIFCGYTAAIELLEKEIRIAGYTCEHITGSVTGLKRAQILEDFQTKPDPHVLICHPTTTAMGVELSAADTMIFNGVPLTGGFVYAQSLERLSSTKQKAASINIIHIVATAEERRALSALQQGYNQGQQIAALFEEIAKGGY